MAAVYVDLALSSLGVTYNVVAFLLLFFVDRIHRTQAFILGSYAVGCFFCSVYYVYFDLSVLVQDEFVGDPERGMLYVLMLFLAYHLMLHIYLLSWDQYRSVFRCRSHLRYLTTDRLVKISFIIWFGSVVLSVLEAIFLNNVSDFPQTSHVSEFRMVCVLLLLFFFWLLPLVIMTCWNGDLFCFLLKVLHHGYVIEEPVELGFKPEIMPELAPCPWFGEAPPRNNDGSSFVDTDDQEDEDEPPTIPDDVRSELARCFMHLVTTTLFGAPVFVWLTYNILAIMRTGLKLTQGWEDAFYESIYSCSLFICLYFTSKLFAIFNPLFCYYYRLEIRRLFKRVVLRLQRAPDNLAQLD